MIDCSVAKQSLVALSFGEAEFYGIVRAVVTSKQTSQVLHQTAVQHEESARERDPGKVRHLFDQGVGVSQEGVPVCVGRHVVELGGHWNESTHV